MIDPNGTRTVPREGSPERSAGLPSRGTVPAADPEVLARATRRCFSADYKQRIVQEADACTVPGQIGSLLRREGIYSSILALAASASDWECVRLDTHVSPSACVTRQTGHARFALGASDWRGASDWTRTFRPRRVRLDASDWTRTFRKLSTMRVRLDTHVSPSVRVRLDTHVSPSARLRMRQTGHAHASDCVRLDTHVSPSARFDLVRADEVGRRPRRQCGIPPAPRRGRAGRLAGSFGSCRRRSVRYGPSGPPA